ncbi:MAG: SDR family oxidoreductase [Gracilimonas sp.]|uniref:polysaccharide biosynthesis C-terminal domain-containing protein n=1 Tax=Gracilimonas sp. TaxID=1974203 RepID=UPI0019C24177|nr:NAD-dependent epimerase/dehydratase family protein [Gracilimonas sp.]MBD3614987.1 SDR family oxidoreductase [Gracilimonas sp.]
MIKVGITGQNGFIGQHLFRTLNLFPDNFQIVPFDREYFKNETELNSFVEACDTIVHLAALNRHDDPQVIYDTNVMLVHKLIEACRNTDSTPHILMSSSTQEERDNLYGQSKKEGRKVLAKWAKEEGAVFTGLVIPNVYGPFGKPFYNSVVATFCHQLTHGEQPAIHRDGQLELIYVGSLVEKIIDCIEQKTNDSNHLISADTTVKVSEILAMLSEFKETYFEKGEIPELTDTFSLNLFNTFRCYIDMEEYFPVNLTKHADDRGAFVEVIRLGIGGQASFSTTVPGITRGNHYHTRKIERFAVIKGKARIELRLIGTGKVFSFELDGEQPGYVDMPIWYTHNISNIGDDELYTIFWINEPYDPEDADTYYEEV